MIEVVFGVVGFTVIIVGLVLILMVAKAQLVPSGSVTIDINDDPDNRFESGMGGTLLGALAAKKTISIIRAPS